MQDLTESLRDHAKASHAAYPQYDGYYDSWTLGEITRRVRTKGGVDVAAGTLVLANFDHDDLDGEPVVSFYDPATTHNVVVAPTTIRRRKRETIECPTEVSPASQAHYAVRAAMQRHPEGLVWFEA